MSNTIMGKEQLYYKTKIMFKVIIILLLPLTLFSQTGTTKSIDNRDTIPNIITFDGSIIKDINKSAFEIYVTIYSDSINNAASYKMLPHFLKDPNFDYHNSNFWFPPQSKVSLRNIIILRTNNCYALKSIIADKSNIYKKKPKKEYNFDFSDLSFYDLVVKRYFSLECDK